MTATTTAHNSTTARELAQALAENRLDEADELLAGWTDPMPRDVALVAADLHMKRCRFVQARQILDGLSDLDIHGRLKRNGARNYASLERHRPQIHRRLIAAKISDRFRLVPAAGNRLTIADLKVPTTPTLLTPGGDPVVAVQQTLQQLERRIMEGAAIGLVGIGDGYVLGTLALIKVRLFMDMQVCIHLLEPDLSLLHMCLLLHDFSGPNGPIEQPRFQWFVGPDWNEQFIAAMQSDLMLPRPGVIVQQSTDRQLITPVVHEVSGALDRREADARARAEAYYARVTAGQLASCFAGQADRPPRVLLLTSRFTTVLQYATRDIAKGFEANGWRTLTLIEPTPYHQISRLTTSEALASFKPDLVFQIDHLRHEHEEAFPANLPFACWIQDHLAHLTRGEAGRQVRLRDYVLTFASPLFIDTYSYPARQCIDMPMMLTSPRTLDGVAKVEAPDLVYVSNVSQQPRELIARVLEQTPQRWQALARDAAELLLSRYEAGGSLASHHEVRLVLEDAIKAGRHDTPDDADLRRLVEDLWNPLNIASYRQQALGWAASAARRLNLSLGIYGRGWDQHPDFAAHARGVIENGRPLAQLTRSARINLNLEPYVCFTHQRLLDGLVAGGFYLVRRHPGNTLLQQLLNFIEEHCDAARTTAQAIATCEPSRRAELRQLLDGAACVTFEENADAVRQVRCWQRAGVLIRQEVALPHLADISFHDEASCLALIGRYIRSEKQRGMIAESQRKSIEQRLSFPTGMGMVTQRIASLLREESPPESPAPPEAVR